MRNAIVVITMTVAGLAFAKKPAPQPSPSPAPSPPPAAVEKTTLVDAARLDDYLVRVNLQQQQCNVVVLSSEPYAKAMEIANRYKLHVFGKPPFDAVDLETGVITRAAPEPSPPPAVKSTKHTSQE